MISRPTRASPAATSGSNFFGKSAATKLLVKDMTDDQIWSLKRGGHDYRKVYAAYHAATVRNGRPTVVLAKTVKGYGLGANFEARNATHQMKKLTIADLKQFRDLMDIPVTDEQIEEDAVRRAVLPSGRRLRRRSSTSWSGAASSAASSPSGATSPGR